MSRKGAIPDFYRSRRYLSYAEMENDHSIMESLNVYSVPYVGSSVMLNMGALLGRGELKSRKYGMMLFNL
jgi:hypothetical protein